MARNVVNLSHFGWLLVPLAVGFGVFGSSSCIQIGPDASEGGSDAGGDTPKTHTLGEQCAAIAAEYCARTNACELEEDPQACQDSGVSSCCGSHCDATSTISETAIAGCVADLRNAGCDVIAAILGGDPGALPSRCQNVFGKQ